MAKKSIREIIAFLQENNLLTGAVSTEKVIDRFNNGKEIYFVLTSGTPKGTDVCSRCHKEMNTSHFSYYQARVNEDGYLSRSNAVCKTCSKKSLKRRGKIFSQEKENIPPRPKKGSLCPRCKRKWNGKWHRDHNDRTGKFTRWLCGNCNMSKGDQRNPHIVMDE